MPVNGLARLKLRKKTLGIWQRGKPNSRTCSTSKLCNDPVLIFQDIASFDGVVSLLMIIVKVSVLQLVDSLHDLHLTTFSLEHPRQTD